MYRILGGAAAAVMATVLAIPASAASLGNPIGCEGFVVPAAATCYGAFAGNVLSGNSGDRALQQEALDALNYTGPAISQGHWSSVLDQPGVKISPSGDDYVFGPPISGVTIFAIHFGNGARYPGTKDKIFSDKGGGTIFFKFDAGAGLAGNKISITTGGGSSAVLYHTAGAVPEPASWAMMIGGFGLAGATLRRRRTITKVSYA